MGRVRLRRLLFLATLVLSASPAFADESLRLYRSGVVAARKGDLASAFMSLRDLATDFPNARHAADALFATGEYYFLMGDYSDSRAAFIRFVTENPGSKAKPFAYVYLAEIARAQSQQELSDRLRKEVVVSEQIVLLFRDFKEFQYLSSLNRRHKAVHYIDRIEFFIDGELFAQIAY